MNVGTERNTFIEKIERKFRNVVVSLSSSSHLHTQVTNIFSSLDAVWSFTLSFDFSSHSIISLACSFVVYTDVFFSTTFALSIFPLLFVYTYICMCVCGLNLGMNSHFQKSSFIRKLILCFFLISLIFSISFVFNVYKYFFLWIRTKWERSCRNG